MKVLKPLLAGVLLAFSMNAYATEEHDPLNCTDTAHDHDSETSTGITCTMAGCYEVVCTQAGGCELVFTPTWKRDWNRYP